MADPEVMQAIKEIRDNQISNGLILQRIGDVVLGVEGSTLSLPVRLQKIEDFEAKEHMGLKLLLLAGGMSGTVLTSYIVALLRG